MKRYLMYVFVLIVFSTTACSSSVENLSEEENSLIAEYVGGTLLKYDKNYSEKLVISSVESTKTPVQETPGITEENKEDTESIKNDYPVGTTQPKSNDVEVEDVFSEAGLTLKFVRYGYFEDYPIDSSNSYFTLKSEVGKKILVLEFELFNKNKSLNKVNLVNSKIKYLLSVNKKNYSPSITFLVNDLQYFKADLSSQKSKRAVLVFEVPNQLETDTFQLKLLKGEKTASITVK